MDTTFAGEITAEAPAECSFSADAEFSPAPSPVARPKPRPVYRPPFPKRVTKQPRLWSLLLGRRRNILSLWPDFTYSSGSFSFSVLERRVHVVSTPDVVREVFVDKAEAVAEKTWQQRHVLRPLAGRGLIISGGDLWRTRRPKVTRITHISDMPSLSRAMSAGAAGLVRDWIARGNGFEVDLIGEMGRLAAANVTSAVFQSETDPVVVARVVRNFDLYQSYAEQIDSLSFLRALDALPRFVGLRAALAARAIRRDLDQMIDGAVADQRWNAPVLRPFVTTGANETPVFDRKACRDEAAVMLLAGYETTANTMAWAFFLLSQDPVSERRLHAEVDRAFDETAEFETLSSLPYTRAVIQETLRLYPPVPMQARRANRPFQIGQKAVAAGDTVVLNAWILHRHRRYWEEPDAFMPERFMPGNHEAPSRYAFVPFGIGPRVCTGAAFGLTEAILCLATLARRFRLRLRPGTSVEPTCQLSLRPGYQLPMIVEQRYAP